MSHRQLLRARIARSLVPGVVLACVGVTCAAPFAHAAESPAQRILSGLQQTVEDRRRELPPARAQVERSQKRLAIVRSQHFWVSVAGQPVADAPGAHPVVATVVREPDISAMPYDSAVSRVERREQAARLQLGADVEVALSALEQMADAQRRFSAFQLAVEQSQERAREVREAAESGEVANDRVQYGWGGLYSTPVTSASIDAYLARKGSPMAGQGRAFLRSGAKHNIDPRLIVAIAGAESNFGQITCNDYNAWGWACPNSPVRFDSWAEGIEAVSKGLRENYLDDGLRTVRQIQERYAPSNAENDPTGLNLVWSLNVEEFLIEQNGNPTNLERSAASETITGVD